MIVMIAWRNKRTGKWLVIDETRSHTKISDSFRFTGDINQASITSYVPQVVRPEVEPVSVKVKRIVTIVNRDAL